MSRLIRSFGFGGPLVRSYATKLSPQASNVRIPSKEFDKGDVQAYLQSVSDPTGEYHSELFFVMKTVTVDPDLEDKMNDYLSKLAVDQSRSKNRG